MVRLKCKYYRGRCKRAFTLVELIVVLVILAVIAAMLVPALTGYIKKAKKERYYTQAHYALVAAQSVMTEYYAKNGGTPLARAAGKNDVWWTDANNEWGSKILELIDRDRNNQPYYLIFGVGKDPSLQFTVLFLAYMEDVNSPAVFYVDGEWCYTYPWRTPELIKGTNGGNKLMVGPHTGTVLQLVVVCNKTNSERMWEANQDVNSLENHSEPNFKY